MGSTPLAIASSTPRTLNILKPPIVQRLLVSPESEAAAAALEEGEDSTDDNESSGGESGSDDERFSHPPGYVPHISETSCHGPHVAQIPEIATVSEAPTGGEDDEDSSEMDTPSSSSGGVAQPRVTALSAARTRAPATSPSRALRSLGRGEDPAGMPYFAITVYTRGVRSSAIEIPRDPTQQLSQDLIFSIQSKGNNNGDAWKLMELSLTIPFGQPDSAAKAATDPSTANYSLMSQYTGPGATMLSNLRFNVLVALVTKDEKPALQLRLLPRAKDGFIPIDKVEDISFLLALADINRWDGQTPRDSQPKNVQPAQTTMFKQLSIKNGVKAQYYPRDDRNQPRAQDLNITVYYSD